MRFFNPNLSPLDGLRGFLDGVEKEGRVTLELILFEKDVNLSAVSEWLQIAKILPIYNGVEVLPRGPLNFGKSSKFFQPCRCCAWKTFVDKSIAESKGQGQDYHVLLKVHYASQENLTIHAKKFICERCEDFLWAQCKSTTWCSIYLASSS